MQPILALDAIQFAYPGSPAPVLAGASLSLRRGERTALLGDNGSGKSTLLHIASGLIKPAGGTVAFKGSLCLTEKDFIPLRHALGYVLQHSEDQLFCPTVLEDVAFGPVNMGMREKEAAEKARNILNRLGIAHLADRNGSTLSGGQKKLAALATVLVTEPEFLFLDEPTNDLDQTARETLILTLEKTGLPCIAISHDADFLARLCNQSLTLENGMILP
ncbi:MAG: Nickel import ATP-binding protein NikO [Desulfovibrio sp.]